MLLATRCPFCETVFRLQTEQLALRRGLVRCGHCHEVFDASSSLFDITEGGDFSSAKPVAAAAAIEALSGVRPKGPDFSAEAWDPWAPAPDATIDNRLRHHAGNVPLSPVSTDAGVAVTPRHAAEPELPAGAFTAPIPPDHEPILADAPLDPFAYDVDPPVEEAPRVWHKTERASDAPLEEPVLDESATLHGIPDNEPRFGAAGVGAAGVGAAGVGAAGAGAASFGGASAAATAGPVPASGEPFSVQPVNDGAEPFPVVRETRPAEPRRTGWIIVGSVVAGLLIIALLAQLAWWQRETVMVYLPRSQTLYAKACATLGCLVTPPHDIDGLQVEPSDLRQIDGPHKLELKMPLRNRFNIALAYPAIELTLLDDQNNVAVRRVLWPQDYVPPGTAIAAGLPAHTTQTMIVHLDTGNAVASNFRVQIFYP
ncbi:MULTISPECIES: zinc-ribbon and DUF3426 domain-containing protein [Paraburkholderia]|uniref:zinc-ribbon and DUF3426 domain-containing protein n=1 Tax=Paraburkholderia TaxID=1822464 RepID=UPI0038B9B7F5